MELWDSIRTWAWDRKHQVAKKPRQDQVVKRKNGWADWKKGTTPPLPTKSRGSWFYLPSACFNYLAKFTADQGLTIGAVHHLAPTVQGKRSYQATQLGQSPKPGLEKILEACLFQKACHLCTPTLSPAYKSSQAESGPKPVPGTFLFSVLPPLCSSKNLLKYVWKFI